MDYCQYLISSQVNSTLTNLAQHLQSWSHDTINGYLRGETLPARVLWENAPEVMEFDAAASLVFDDTVLHKEFGPCLERTKRTRRLWSGNAPEVINGIGLVWCLYVHPCSGRFWVLDDPLFAPERDGQTKLDHVSKMRCSLGERPIPFGPVWMDSWYATQDLMLDRDGYHHSSNKIFYGPLKSDPLVDDSVGG